MLAVRMTPTNGFIRYAFFRQDICGHESSVQCKFLVIHRVGMGDFYMLPQRRVVPECVRTYETFDQR